MRVSRRPLWLLVLSIILPTALIVAACGAGGESATAPTVSDAWVRPPMGADRPAAGYLTIVGSGSADALVGASSPIAASVEIHETTMGSDGSMGMHGIPRLEIAAGATIGLEPGGYHLMLMGVTQMPAVGEMVEITLVFEHAGDVVVSAEVRAG